MCRLNSKTDYVCHKCYANCQEIFFVINILNRCYELSTVNQVDNEAADGLAKLI